MAHENEGISSMRGVGVPELLKLLKNVKKLSFEDVEIVAEELTFELIPIILQAVSPETQKTLNQVKERVAELASLLGIATPTPTPPTAPPPVVEKPLELEKVTFEPPIFTYTGEIAEVKIGATANEGGTRRKVIKIGGEKSPAFYRFESPTPNRPVVALDVFDELPPLPKTIKECYRDVFKDHAAWMNKCIEEYKADLVTVHLVSTDPSGTNTPAPEAAKFIDKLLDAVDYPFLVGGSGDPEKDLKVFNEVGKVAKGERIVLASVTLDMDLQQSAKIISENGLDVIALAFLDINQVKELNSKLMDYGVSKNNLITDPSTGGLGYGLEYTFSMMERMRLAGLMGDPSMQVPISCAATNGWAAREAWLKFDEWGPREYRGPLWEAVTGLLGLFAGADLFMMMHPLAAQIVKNTAEILSKHKIKEDIKEIPYENWVKMKVW